MAKYDDQIRQIEKCRTAIKAWQNSTTESLSSSHAVDSETINYITCFATLLLDVNQDLLEKGDGIAFNTGSRFWPTHWGYHTLSVVRAIASTNILHAIFTEIRRMEPIKKWLETLLAAVCNGAKENLSKEYSKIFDEKLKDLLYKEAVEDFKDARRFRKKFFADFIKQGLNIYHKVDNNALTLGENSLTEWELRGWGNWVKHVTTCIDYLSSGPRFYEIITSIYTPEHTLLNVAAMVIGQQCRQDDQKNYEELLAIMTGRGELSRCKEEYQKTSGKTQVERKRQVLDQLGKQFIESHFLGESNAPSSSCAGPSAGGGV